MVIIRFSEDAQQTLSFLQTRLEHKYEAALIEAIHQKLGYLQANVHYGHPLAKRLVPSKYRKVYGFTLIFRIELPFFWRMLYTLTRDESELEIIAFVLDIIDHKEYNALFKYKNK